MDNLVIGNGEVGSAIAEVLGCKAIDLGGDVPQADIIHICFPYTLTFPVAVKQYQEHAKAKYTVIHSTVPVGTSSKLNATHSPVRGKHPDLAKSIRTFVKFFGGPDSEHISELFHIDSNDQVTTVATDKSDSTEAMKLWSTEQYRIQILEMQGIWHFCQEHNIDFNIVYTKANETYNEGYAKMDLPQFKRSVLEYMGDEIGGHCVEANHKLLYDK